MTHFLGLWPHLLALVDTRSYSMRGLAPSTISVSRTALCMLMLGSCRQLALSLSRLCNELSLHKAPICVSCIYFDKLNQTTTLKLYWAFLASLGSLALQWFSLTALQNPVSSSCRPLFFSKQALINPLYKTCRTPNDRQTKIEVKLVKMVKKVEHVAAKEPNIFPQELVETKIRTKRRHKYNCSVSVSLLCLLPPCAQKVLF